MKAATAAGDIDGLSRMRYASETITRADSTTASHDYSCAYDMRSQLTGATITNIGGDVFDPAWDLNGNMIVWTAPTFEYNWDNKLRHADSGLQTIDLKYDPLGNRIFKNSTVSGNRKYVVYIAGRLPTILMVMEPNDGNDIIMKTYIYFNRSQIMAQYDGGYTADKYFYIHDRLGSVRQLVNSDGGVMNHYTYNPFGSILEESSDESPVVNHLLFTC